MSSLLAVAPAVPGPGYGQDEIAAAIAPMLAPARGGAAAVARLHSRTGVRRRHLVLPPDTYGGLTFARSNALFAEHGLVLAARACRDALAAARLSPTDVDLVYFTTVTGIGAPSLDVALAGDLGLRPDVRRVPTFGLGCAGGAGALVRVDDHLRGAPDAVALVVAVELCSLTFQHGDASGANVVACGLFGDGAGAAVLVGDAHPAARRAPARLTRTRSVLVSGTGTDLGWSMRDTGFAIVLSPRLPDLLAEHVPREVKTLLGAEPADVVHWIVHAGGPRILDAVEASLALPPAALAASRASLAENGNLSSVSVLDVLARTLDSPAPGPGVLMAFGPGVGIELVLLEVA